MFRKSALLMIVALVLAACGSIATPVWNAPEEGPTEVHTNDEAASAPTTVVEPTTVPPTATEPPATPSFTPEPPTATTVPPTATTAAAASDPITVLVSLSNPNNGKTLFETFYDEAGFACATCHRVDSEEKLVGPGLLNVGVRGGTDSAHSDPSQPGEAAERYIYNSIIHPNDFVVPDFPENLMPQVYQDLFSEQEIYDIIAYLMSLKS